MDKELTLENLREIVLDGCEYQKDLADFVMENIMQWHKSECKRFALECVPEKRDEYWHRISTIGFNICREQMIKNIEEKNK